MTTIYFIRHGQASFGAESYDKLSQVGEEQSKILGEYLKNIFKEKPLVISGSMQRHQQTAEISLKACFENIEIETNAAWNEFNHQQIISNYEPRFDNPALLKQDIGHESNPRAYLFKVFEGAIRRWTSGEFDHDYDESWLEFKLRVENALDELCIQLQQQKRRYVVVYTSGGVISVLIAKLLGLSVEKTFELNLSIANSSITTARLIGSKPHLSSMNELHFIKPHAPQMVTLI